MNKLISFFLIFLLMFLNQAALGAGEIIKLKSFTVESSNPSTLDEKKPVIIKGKLSFPENGKEKMPLVIHLLGGGGFSKMDAKWMSYFRKKGFATLWVDVYTPRGLSLKEGLGSSDSGLSSMSYLNDVFAAIKFAKSHPKIDGNKIVTFGSSWGGTIQVFLLSDWYTQKIGGGDTIAGHILVAPACWLTVDKPKPSSLDSRTLIIYGEKDNWNEPGPCRDFTRKLTAQGANIVEKTIKGGHHGFDVVKKKRTRKRTSYHCQVTFDPETMQGFHRRENKTADLAKSWDNLWDDCIKETNVTKGGTKAQLKTTLRLISEHLNLIMSQS